MKKSILLLMAAFLFTLTGLAQKTKPAAKTETATFEVNGNCGMCKRTIEKAAKAAGAVTAVWNEEKHQLTVKFSPKKTTVKKIQEKVAASGYDNAGATASQEAYDGLHSCCKYERKAIAPAN
jgi:periplasmic mercuric ion binding protein